MLEAQLLITLYNREFNSNILFKKFSSEPPITHWDTPPSYIEDTKETKTKNNERYQINLGSYSINHFVCPSVCTSIAIRVKFNV